MGRKNIGYMYSIKHVAESIWDFDDHNINKLPEKKVSKTKCKTVEHIIGRRQSVVLCIWFIQCPDADVDQCCTVIVQ